MTTNDWGPAKRGTIALAMVLSLFGAIGATAGSGMTSTGDAAETRLLADHCPPFSVTPTPTRASRTTPAQPVNATPVPVTASATATSASVPTNTPTATGTVTATATSTSTLTATNTPTSMPTTSTPTSTATNTPTNTPTSTPTIVPVLNPSNGNDLAGAPERLGYGEVHPDDCVTPTVDRNITVLPSTGQVDAGVPGRGTGAQIGLAGATIVLMLMIGVMALRRRRS